MDDTNKNTVARSHQGITLIAKWGAEKITLNQLDGETNIGTVKDLLSQRTGVLPKRQKLIGLKASSKINDGVLLRELKIKNSKKSTNADGTIVHEVSRVKLSFT